MAEWNTPAGLNVGLFLAFTQSKIDELGGQQGRLLRSVLLKSISEKAAELVQREPHAYIHNDGAIEILHPAAAAWNPSRLAPAAWSPARLSDLEDPFERDFQDLSLLANQPGDDAAQDSLSVDFSILRLLDEEPQEAGPDSSDDAPTAPGDAAAAGTLPEGGQASLHGRRQPTVGEEHADKPELPEQADMAHARAAMPWFPPFQRSSPPGANAYQLFPSTDESAEDSDEVALPDVSPGADVDFGDSFGFGVPGDL